ncbi:MAG: hypothetical protein JW878_09535 [Methanomicrobia archaeon]|nr:hypothetical protein [Methanomicrobia archaeon]
MGMLRALQASQNLSESEKMIVGTVREVFNDFLNAVYPYRDYSSTPTGISGPVRDLKTAAEEKEDLSKFAEKLKTEIAEKLKTEIATLKKRG